MPNLLTVRCRIFSGCIISDARCQSRPGSFYFRFLFAFAQSPAQFAFAPDHDRHKRLGMIRAALIDNLVGGRLGADGLQNLLQLSLGVLIHGRFSQLQNFRKKELPGQSPRGLHAAIDKNGPDQGFHRIGERGIPFPATVAFLATTHQEKAAKLDLTADICQGFGGDKLGAHLGEQAFIRLRESLKEDFRKKQLNHSITQEFEPLVVGLRVLGFVAEAGVRESLCQQGSVMKRVSNAGFEKFHGAQRMEVSFNQASSHLSVRKEAP